MEELRGAEYRFGVVYRVEFDAGLTDAEVAETEELFGSGSLPISANSFRRRSRSAIAPRWGAEMAWIDRNSARWAGLRKHGLSARRTGDCFRLGKLRPGNRGFRREAGVEARRVALPQPRASPWGCRRKNRSRGGLKGRATASAGARHRPGERRRSGVPWLETPHPSPPVDGRGHG
jgi:hypothetical protein